MKIRTMSISLSVMLLATLLVPVAVSSPVQAQSQTSWYVNDNPTLFGPQQFWFHGASGHGYGTNNYRYTYATGGDPSPNNWARWNMGSRVGQQEIQVYVPSNHATATVNYNVTIGGSTSKVRVAQNGTRGWYSLGNWNTNGANVVVAVYDNDAEHHHERNGLASSSIGVDAIRMRRSDLPPPEDPDPPRPPINLRLQVVTESDGSSTVVATWSPPSSDGGSAITGYKVTFSRPGRTFDTVDRSASSRRSTINRALANTTYTVRVRAENRVGLSSTASASVRTPGPPPDPNAGRPELPRNLRLQVVSESDGSRTVVATWSPPSSDGESAITRYQVTFSRPGRTFDTGYRSASSRRSTITGAWANTTYTVRVRAENRIGLSSTVSASVRTPGPPPGPSPERPQPPRNLRLQVVTETNGSRTVVATWSPPSSDGESAITGYKVTFSRPGRTFNTLDRSASNRRSTITNAFANTTYTVRVQAENRIGLSRSDSATVKVSCPNGRKFSEVNDAGRHNKIVALQTFAWVPDEGQELITETIWINRRTEGGQVRHHDSLSQSGCSWVVKGSIVKGDGKVYGNALITNGATVEDDAKVYGNAIVSDARIAGDAKVYGNAEVWGDAVIKGSAKISGNVKINGLEISSGRFDGVSEYVQLLYKTYIPVYKEVYRVLSTCLNRQTKDAVHKRVKAIFNLGASSGNESRYRVLWGCVHNKMNTEIFFATIPSWTAVLPLGLDAAATLINLSKIAQNLKRNERIKQAIDGIRALYKEIEDETPCEELCEKNLSTLRNANYEYLVN